MHLANCPACGRAVSMLREGELCNHGPGPGGEFACPGSGDQSMVQAAQHLHIVKTSEVPRRGAPSVKSEPRTDRR